MQKEIKESIQSLEGYLIQPWYIKIILCNLVLVVLSVYQASEVTPSQDFQKFFPLKLCLVSYITHNNIRKWMSVNQLIISEVKIQ